MSLHQLHLICFGAGTVIHAAYVVLVAGLWRRRTAADRTAVLEGLAIGFLSLLWQAGNFTREFALTIGDEGTAAYQIANVTRGIALVCFPLMFSYMCLHLRRDIPAGRLLVQFGGMLRYPLWPWTLAAIFLLNDERTELITLNLMLMYFVLFTVVAIKHRPEIAASENQSRVRAHHAAIVAAFVAAAIFVLMLTGIWTGTESLIGYISLAAMMTSVPFIVAHAYRFYQFPFMDVFVREAWSGTILLSAFVVMLAVESRLQTDLLALFATASAMLLAYAKGPVTRWVERKLMGHEESIEQQEERIGNAIRALTRLDEFPARVSEILASELEAQWVEVNASPRAGAAHRFEIAGPSPLWLSAGPRIGGRQYMSRELRLARTAALQLSAHHHHLVQQELRDVTARAQMRALQAQINPHFLFNTLNVLANLIHTNPPKAERVTEELAEIFRYALESTRAESVTLDDELRFLESYLDIEKARFEERLTYSLDVDPAIRGLKIPPMILQPVVENALQHGLSPKVEGGHIRISSHFEVDHLVLVVEDSGVGPSAKIRQRGAGIGLANVRERLQHVYGESASLKLEERQPSGTRAVLVLPQLTGVHS